MQLKPTVYALAIAATMIATGIPMLSGCNPTEAKQGADAQTKKLPKLKFHKPKTFQGAVARLNELREAVVSEEALPEPKSFRVVESIHGTGPGAHSHYNLAKDSSDQSQADAHGHGHDDEESSEKFHDVLVDPITEMMDIVKWMPDIAAETDMNKTSWETVKTESDQLHSVLEDKLKDTDKTERKRETIRTLNDELVRFANSMSTLSAELTESERNQQ